MPCNFGWHFGHPVPLTCSPPHRIITANSAKKVLTGNNKISRLFISQPHKQISLERKQELNSDPQHVFLRANVCPKSSYLWLRRLTTTSFIAVKPDGVQRGLIGDIIS